MPGNVVIILLRKLYIAILNYVMGFRCCKLDMAEYGACSYNALSKYKLNLPLHVAMYQVLKLKSFRIWKVPMKRIDSTFSKLQLLLCLL